MSPSSAAVSATSSITAIKLIRRFRQMIPAKMPNGIPNAIRIRSITVQSWREGTRGILNSGRGYSVTPAINLAGYNTLQDFAAHSNRAMRSDRPNKLSRLRRVNKGPINDASDLNLDYPQPCNPEWVG